MNRKENPVKVIKNGIIIKAVFIRDTKESWLLDCEGDIEWFPKSEVNFDADKQELEAPKWLLEKKFPDTKF
jgi:hypothetical protein